MTMGPIKEQTKIIPHKGEILVSDIPFEPYKPPKKSLKELIYSKKSGKFLGRTKKSWGQLFVFYTIYFILLFALFGICMKALLMTCPERMPVYQLGDSLIGTNPGVGFRPMPEHVDHGSLIWYDASNQTEVSNWVKILDEYLQGYTFGGSNQKNCDFETFPGTPQVCKVDISKFEGCTSSNAYGYNNTSPCIFIKLNRIYGWIPEFYNDPEDLPKEMPDDLKAHIAGLPESHRNQIWVSCLGENGSDQQIIGNVQYYPMRGFPSYFYPYLNAPGYVSPLVAVQFENPTPNQIINVECRAWAKNIKYVRSSRDRQGSVHFELMIDVPTN